MAVLGDSLVWGELLAREHTLPALLDARLGSRAEVLNFGVSGYDTVQEARWYTRQVRPFEPDVVVLVFCLNDLLTMSGPLQLYASPPRKRAYELERAWVEAQAPVRNESISRLWLEERRGEGSQLMAAVHHVQRWHQLFTLPGGYTDELLLSFSDPARVRRMEAALTQLGKDLDADGVRGLVVISPALYWWHRYQWWGPHEVVTQAAEAAGLEVLDPMRQWEGQDHEELRFAGDNLHYTPAGMERLADAVQPALEAILDEVDAAPAP